MSAQTHTTRGHVLGQLNNHERAIADLTRALELDHANGWAAKCRTETLWHLGRFETSLADYQSRSPTPARTATCSADVACSTRAMGRLAEARADFRRAIELDPDLADELGAIWRTSRLISRPDKIAALAAIAAVVLQSRWGRRERQPVRTPPANDLQARRRIALSAFRGTPGSA